jgi:hypothetical protein
MKRLLLFGMLIGMLFSAQQLNAQARKIAFFEHFTNASCAPCASQNPVFQSEIMDKNKGNLIHMAYHTVWPGRDPMNAYNQTEVDTRVKFYGVSGVPNMILQGDRYDGSPVGVSQELLDRVTAEASPLRILVQESSNGTQRSVTATFTSMGPVPTAGIKVRAAVIEEEIIYASAPGTNGEKEFPNVFRRFINAGSAAGDSFTPAGVGESTTLTWSYDLEPDTWDTTKVFPVVWVQLDGSAEVINASAPFIPATEFVLEGTAFKKGTPQQSVTFNARIDNLGNTQISARLGVLGSYPADWSISYEVNGNTYSDAADVTVDPSTSLPVLVTIEVGDDPGIGDIMMKMTSLDDTELTPQYVSLGVISNVTDIVINNDNSWGADDGTKAQDFEQSYLSGIASAGSTTHASTSLTTFLRAYDAAMLDDVKHLYYNGGWAFPGLPDNFSRAMLGFLGQGGNLLVAGQDLGWDTFDPNGHGTSAARAFYRSYLFANFTDDGSTANATTSFYETDVLFGSVQTSALQNVYGSSSQGQAYMYPDQLTPAPGGVALAYYNGNQNMVGAIRGAKNEYKTVYFGFGMEQIKDAAIRDEAMKITWQWFHGIISSVDYDASVQSLMLGQNYPNPVSSSTIIPLTSAARERMLQVYDINGRLVTSRTIAAGSAQVQLNSGELNPGMYFYQLLDGGKVVGSKLMQVLR